MAGVLVLITLLTLVSVVLSAYPVLRPIDPGAINQTYLWGDETTIGGRLFSHKGVDFPTGTGTEVRAAASGTVVAVDDHLDDDDHTTLWGNYIVIRHHAKHWDKDNGATGGSSYVYSMYLHLQHNQVQVDAADTVTTDQFIARSDNTGNSSAPHLHYQIVLHPSRDINTIEGLNSSTTSRNPELWLTPLVNTGTAIGKVTDNGVPVGNLLVCGIRKTVQTIVQMTPIRTYSFDWANPDDLLSENFGTTDVLPGNWTLYANERSRGCAATPHNYELGTYAFSAERVTYIGLYPYWLPTLKPSRSSNWDVQTYVRNLGTNWRSAMNVTYFHGKYATQQWARTANGQETILIDGETNESYNSLIVPSLDAAVLELQRFNGQPAGTTGISAFNGRGAAGWERAGATLYVPLVKDDWYGRRTQVFVTNTGSQAASISFRFFGLDGTPYPTSGPLTDTIGPNERTALTPWTHLSPGVYSAVISNPTTNQPLAAVALEQDYTNTSTNSAPALYNAYSGGSTTLYAPLIKNKYGGNISGITLQNISKSSTANFTASYYNMSGGYPPVVTVSDSIPSYAPYVLYNPPGLPINFAGSVRITSTNGVALVGEASEEEEYGHNPRLIYNLPLVGTTNIYLPLWYEGYTSEGDTWASGVSVHNTGSAGNEITVTWYNLDGTIHYTSPTVTLAERATYTFYNLPGLSNNFIGSAWIHGSKPIVAVSKIHKWGASSDFDSALYFTGSNR
jgi:murein DD-endopeptidase MepM/ murein hydrolase activator NlpD